MSSPWLTYGSTRCYRGSDALSYAYQTSHVEIDADGAPNAYSAHNPALDYAANAGWPNGAWENCLVPDPENHAHPYVQSSGEYIGYFVSKTSLQDEDLPETDTGRYVDATKIPYIVLPGAFYQKTGTGHMGDFVVAKNVRTGLVSGAIIADVGPYNAHLGEISIALAVALGGHNPSPKDGSGAPVGPFRYVVFPGSHEYLSWPLSSNGIQSEALSLLAKAGGWSAFDKFFQTA